jgi:hypothetical protein
MEEDHLIAAVRYVALNPVRARLVERAAEATGRKPAVRANQELGLE